MDSSRERLSSENTHDGVVQQPSTTNYKILFSGLVLAVGIGILYVLSRSNYLLFHSLVEIFSICVAFAVFVVAWNSRRLLENYYLLFIGIAFLFVGGLELSHMLSYRGMGIFPGFSTNPATQIWIASRYLASLSFLLALLFIHRKFNPGVVFVVYILVMAGILSSIFYWNIFPAAFVEGTGLTLFKIVSEYVVSFILLLSIILMLMKRQEFGAGVVRLIVAAMVTTIVSEMAFTLYNDAYGIANMIGHLLMILAYYLIYKALIETGLTRPYTLLFHNLKKSEMGLAKHAAQLTEVNNRLAQEVVERKKVEEALKNNNERLKILSETSHLLLSSDTPENIVQTIAGKVMIHLGYECFFNFIVDEEAGKLRLNAYAGIPEETAAGIQWLEFGSAICGCVARDGCRIVSENVQENGDLRATLVRSFGIQAYASHPLKVGPQTIGTLSFGSRKHTSFSQDELDLMMTVANQVSVAMERKRIEESLKKHAVQLEYTNKELEAFSYSVSHDLRAPLRTLDGFSQAIMEDYADKLDESGKQYLMRVRNASQVMSQLIDGMLKLSRVGRAEMHFEEINLSQTVQSIVNDLMAHQPERRVGLVIAPDIIDRGDSPLLRSALQNLLENAWKFTQNCSQACIEFGMTMQENQKVYYIKDNGAGFDAKYSGKLFQPFQRLHSEHEYPGTGIGLATVQRIIRRHGGNIWAESELGKGATFFFTLN